MRYVGLTDDPKSRKHSHGKPSDFEVVKRFKSELGARIWEKKMLSRKGYTGGPGGKGWKYGYTYKITSNTIQ